MEASGQRVNAEKLEILFINTKPGREIQICNMLGYKRGAFPCKYLGIELEKGSKTNKGWHNILDRMDKKIGRWKDKWLKKMGKVIKIKAVLSTLPTYLLSCLPLSKNMNKKMEAKLRNFFWNDNEDHKKLALIKWENYVNQRN